MMSTEFMSADEEKRRHRRVFSLVPEEDIVLFSSNGQGHFVAKLLDLSRGGALIYTADPSVGADSSGQYKLYFQSRGAMFHLEGTLIRKELQFFAFQFVNVTPVDLAEIRSKLARMEILAARMCSVGH
jgi:hypothetical protein